MSDSRRSSTPALTAARTLLAAVLLAGPTVLAFYTGGYYDEGRAWAGVAAWALVAAGAAVSRRALPRGRPAQIALAALAALAAWTLASMAWAPIRGYAYHAGQLAFLYLGGLMAAAVLLRQRAALRALEPALMVGTAIVIGYGLSERLLPGLLSFHRSPIAYGRLEQPLTYWNGMGELAAIGLALAVRLAGDGSRARWLRALSAAAAAVLGLGLYVTFSRGALFAGLCGLVALITLVRRRELVRSLVLCVVAAGICVAVAAPMGGVTGLRGTLSTRETQGLIMLIVLVVVAAACAVIQLRLAAREQPGDLWLPRWGSAAATALICVGFALALVLGAKETSKAPVGSNASRLTTLQSDRYAYWDVALRAFAHDPIHGVGAENWWLYWLRDRPTDSAALDAHSLELQTLAELGLVGAALLLAWFGATAVAGRRAHRAAPQLAAGPLAGVVVWLVHSPLDWDWQLPAVTLVAILLAGGLLALAEDAASARAGVLETASTSPDGRLADAVGSPA